jgi:hypothetical protein
MADKSSSELQPSSVRPPSGRLTRSQSATGALQSPSVGANSGTDSLQGQDTEIPMAPPPMQIPNDPSSKAITFESFEALDAYLERWSKSKGAGTSLASFPTGENHELIPTGKKEADRILWRKLPETSQYEDWRYTMLANVVAASIDQAGATGYLNAVDTTEDVSRIPIVLSSLDAKLKAALLSSVQEAPDEHKGRIMAAYGRNPCMTGREFLRVIDQDYGLRTVETLAQRNVSLLTLECRSYREFDTFFTQWKRLDGIIRGSKQDLPEETKQAFLRRALRNIPEVSAILAQNQASLGSYDSLIDALTNHEAIHRTWIENTRKKALAAGTFVEGVQSSSITSFKPCMYCTKRFGGKRRVNHSDSQCFSNPASKNYRPKQRTPSKPANPKNSNTILDSSTIESLAVSLVSKMKERKPDDSSEPLPKVGIAKTSSSVTIDSGATFSISGPENALGSEICRESLDKMVVLECVGGMTEVFDKVLIENPILGEIEALHVESSPPLLSLGQLLNKGYSFEWNPSSYQQPMLVSPTGRKINLQVENFTPVLPLSKAALSLAARPVSSATYSHDSIHFPASKDCSICQVTKSKRTPAYRQNKDYKKSQQFLERVSVDLIEVSEPDVFGNYYLFTLKDDFSGFLGIRAQKTKTASECVVSFQDIIRDLPKVPSILRSDNGKEFLGEFEDEMRRLYIAREFCTPYRSTTNSRHERANQEVNRAIRAILFQSGLPTKFWGLAARYVEHVFNHSMHEHAAFPHNPCEKAMNHPCEHNDRIIQLYGFWPNFGCSASFIPASHNHKFESRLLPGVFVGISGSSDIMVLDLDLFMSKGQASIITSRDVKLLNSVYPGRQLGLRPSADLIFYKILGGDGIMQTQQICMQCSQVRPSFPISCVKCIKNESSNQSHARDETCHYGRCRCKNLPLYAQAESDQSLCWNSEEDEDVGCTDERMEAIEENSETIPYPYDSRLDVFEPLLQEESFVSATPEVSPYLAGVARTLPLDKYINTNEGAAAINEELENMVHHEVWKYDEMIPKHVAAKQNPSAVFVPTRLLLVEKNFELPRSERKLKARLIAQGCLSRNSEGKRVKSSNDFPYESPVSLLSFRLAMWWLSQPGMKAAFADVKSAYLHAPLEGALVFLSLPQDFRPDSWRDVVDPVVPARKAIYGLSQSGADFAKICP